MTDDKKKLTKAEALAAMDEETKLDKLEQELAGKSEEEVMAALVKAGGSRERTEAQFAKEDAMFEAALAEVKGAEPSEASEESIGLVSKAEALAEMIAETDMDALQRELAGKSTDDVMDALVAAGGSRERTAALFAKEDAMFEEALRKAQAAEPSNVVDIQSAKRFGPRQLVTAASPLVAFAACVALVLQVSGVIALGPSQVPPANTGTGAPPTGLNANDIRFNAFREFAQSRWRDCLYDFDHAKELDPAGDNDPAVRDAREKAKQSLALLKDGG